MDVVNRFKELPVITRGYVTLCLITTVACTLEVGTTQLLPALPHRYAAGGKGHCWRKGRGAPAAAVRRRLVPTAPPGRATRNPPAERATRSPPAARR